VSEQPQRVPVAPRASAPSKRPAWLIPAIIAVLMLFGLSFAAFAVDFMGEWDSANATADCAIHQYDIQAAAADYESYEGRAPSTIADLIPGYLPERPSCPDGGSYLYDFENAWLECSVHGCSTATEDCATST
jgi:hypothetical protein